MRQQFWTAALLLLAGCGNVDRAPQGPAPGNVSAAETGGLETNSVADANGDDVSACLVQDGERVPENAIRATGTEPFWGADVEGRCVTYSTPEDQDGTRVWTKFSGSAENGRWAGALDGQEFVMVTRPQQDCSDGMSDFRYPIAVALTVRGERRTGCADWKEEWAKRRPA